MGVSPRRRSAGRCVCFRSEACGLSSARRLRAGRDERREQAVVGLGRDEATAWSWRFSIASVFMMGEMKISPPLPVLSV
jgi:hypothetical protein